MNIPTLSTGLVMAVLAASAGFAHSGPTGMQCGIVKNTEKGMLALQASIISPTAVTGEYRLAIKSASNGGSSSISQGGYFEAAAGQPTALGKVMINVGASYAIALDVTAGGKKLDCGQDLATLL